MSKKRKKVYIAFIIAAVVLVTFPFYGKTLIEPRADFWISKPRIYVTTSDSGYQARFYVRGALHLNIILITGYESAEKVIVGDIYYGDRGPKFETAYWSLDGKVIAAKGYVGKGVKEFVFTHAYDYEEDKVIRSQIVQSGS